MSSFIQKAKGLFSNESRNGMISNRAKFYLAFPQMPLTLSNVLAQEQAKELLATAEEYF